MGRHNGVTTGGSIAPRPVPVVNSEMGGRILYVGAVSRSWGARLEGAEAAGGPGANPALWLINIYLFHWENRDRGHIRKQVRLVRKQRADKAWGNLSKQTANILLTNQQQEKTLTL
ncbi:hypothetical protein XELAEV_18036712mg [Xenopus laevis]|uniref:Uncharacterized protein n=1 Tax=Xenopus laevis TaxID=8355 RepID=A0A974CAY8_XENLA|nr:hypothetical protein XELAEV_18036712mg [Xenopus laevis]